MRVGLQESGKMSDSGNYLGTIYDFKAELHVMNCGVCQVRFAMPISLYNTCMEKDERGEGKKPFYCPNGHRLVFHNREIDALRRDRDRLQQQIARVEYEKAEAERARREAEATLARNMHRAAAGVCPCCHRVFTQLAQHMETQHPELVPTRGKPTSSNPLPMVRKVKGKWTMAIKR